MQENITYSVGIYARLSRDDERTGESVSIENQDRICQGYFHRKIPSARKVKAFFAEGYYFNPLRFDITGHINELVRG